VPTIAQISAALQTVLTTTAEQADAELHYTKRPDLAKFSTSTLLQILVLGWLAHPDTIYVYADAGVNELIIQWFGVEDLEGLQVLAEQALPSIV
jgi:hypothetical protein